MSYLHLIRHAQGGPRNDYDLLSELGQQQARLLGQYLFDQVPSISAVFSGTMNRHRQTAELALNEMRQKGSTVPDVMPDEGWNEFLLAEIYRHYAPRMKEEDPAFARDFLEMQRALESDPHTTRGATGRCDVATIRAWMGNRYADFQGKSWCEFRETVRGAVGKVGRLGRGEQVLVFTSAGPIGITVGSALDLSDEKILTLLGVLYNCNITSFRIVGSSIALFSFNETPHLPSRALRSFR